MTKNEVTKYCTEFVYVVGTSIERFFFWCVDVLVFIGEFTGVGYALANIILFVILQPTLILLFMWLWLKERKQNGR
jgi:hypothetical protein|tara:strand:- start:239 stop:466 length:228 start_codon:yes stop_codon:yes gene_type:complete